MSYHIRRKDKEITNITVLKKILRSTKYITIALSMNNQPYLVTLSHGYDEKKNCIYFHCATEGKKLDYLNSNSTIWGQAILDYGYSEGNCTHLYASVHFSGKVEFINKFEEKHQAIECMIRQLNENPESLITNLNSTRFNETVIGRINIDFLSGKKSKEIAI